MTAVDLSPLCFLCRHASIQPHLFGAKDVEQCTHPRSTYVFQADPEADTAKETRHFTLRHARDRAGPCGPGATLHAPWQEKARA